MSESMARSTGCFASAFRGLDLARRIVLNGLFLLILVLLVVWALSGDTVEVPKGGALVVAPVGDVVEELTGDPLERAVAESLGEGVEQTLYRDLHDALAFAKDDDRIEVVVLDLNRMGGIGPSKVEELSQLLQQLKESGKHIVATADNYTQHRYALAAWADEVMLHDLGLVVLDGYGVYPTYFREGLDRLGVDVHVFRVGEYKSAVEPFLRSDMSPEAEEANMAWLGDLWKELVAGIAKARNLSPEAVDAYAQDYGAALAAHNGDTAQAALAAGLVDKVGSREIFEDTLRELVGTDDETDTFPQVHFLDYLTDRRPPSSDLALGSDRIAVVVAQGTIVDGSAAPGTVGGDSTADLIRRAREDDSVKAIVLRVDSPGGSAFASEIIRQELEAARAQGLPVVVSMSTLAASGGYWIATASDEIWALPTTITGSIGIFGVFATVEQPLQEYLGITVDGVGTTPLAGALRPDRNMEPEVQQIAQQVIEKGYRDFLERVAEARDMTPEEVDRIARGRVWSGAQAKQIGLVDQLGGLDGAVASAAQRAELDEYDLWYPQIEMDFLDQLLLDMAAGAVTRLGLPERFVAPSLFDRVLGGVETRLEPLRFLNDPRGAYAYCFCEVR